MKIGIIGAGKSGGTIATIHGRKLNAIQLTTAAGLTGVLELFARGRPGPGFVKLESVSLVSFLGTRWGGRV